MAESSFPAQATNELTNQLQDALLAETPAFFEALYAVDRIEDTDLRPLIACARDDSKKFFQMARQKLAPKNIEIKSQLQRGSSFIVQFVVNDQSILEVKVDDIYEVAGKLHTRDVIRLDLR